MPRTKAHLHLYDIQTNEPHRVACSICGFAVPITALASEHNLDAITARKNATQAVVDTLEALGYGPYAAVSK